MIFKNASGVHSSSPSPFFRRRFRSQKRNAADVRREVPAAESPTAKGTLDVVGAEETGEDRHEQEPSAAFPCWSPPFPVHTDYHARSGERAVSLSA